MPSRKKHKTNHQGDLTHEEIWDDSALLRSWNDAMEEYKFYHSIHARGEDVDEVLRRVEAEDSKDSQHEEDSTGLLPDSLEGQSHEHQAGNGVDGGTGLDEDKAEVDIDGLMASVEVEAEAQRRSTSVSADQNQNASKEVTNFTDERTKVEPETGQSDQTLENIKMAYYWAGYYSGLYEGQRQVGK